LPQRWLFLIYVIFVSFLIELNNMSDEIIIKEVPIEEAVKVNATIVEFDEPYTKDYFEERYKDKDKLIIAAYLDNQPVGYIVGYDKLNDDSFYCWMTGVNPDFRKRGVFKALMDYQEKWAKDKGYKKIKIKTRNNRREMLGYLVKYGFNVVEVVQYPDIENNRIFFEKVI